MGYEFFLGSWWSLNAKSRKKLMLWANLLGSAPHAPGCFQQNQKDKFIQINKYKNSKWLNEYSELCCNANILFFSSLYTLHYKIAESIKWPFLWHFTIIVRNNGGVKHSSNNVSALFWSKTLFFFLYTKTTTIKRLITNWEVKSNWKLRNFYIKIWPI